MKRIRIVFGMIFLVLFVISGCSKTQDEVVDAKHDDKKTTIKEKPARIESIPLSPYAKEVGFSLKTPTTENGKANTSLELQGSVLHTDGFNEAYIWIVLTKKEAIEEIETDEFHYYIAIENGEFSKQLKLHHGAGDYEVSVRLPSNKPDEDGMFYDAATFTVANQDKDIQREVEYTKYGVQHQVRLNQPVLGMNESSGSVFIEGQVPEGHAGDMVLVQVEKGNENRQIILQVKDHAFSGDVPLYFGEGMHFIRVQTYKEDEDVYYDSATFYVDNQASMEYAEIEKNREYISRGITLYEPSLITEAVQHTNAYHIAGEIDRTAPGADAITHIIVTVTNLDENEESGYLIPVHDYAFDGHAYFRFGPGNYEVIINVPDTEQHDQSMFYYQGVAMINHQVVEIKDERGLLPSRGIESDHPTIIKKAEQITAGVTSEREKARAIYQFVAQHVAYDVKKAEDDIFNIGDSAISTLESGNGICQDYAFLATALLRAVGLESHYVRGDAGERHAWVEVKVDNKWLEMDPTWGAGYVQDGVFHFEYNEDYFDPDPAFLAETHTREGIMY